MSHADPETLVAMNGGRAEGISPGMIKSASNMISNMSPEELQRMLQLASSFQGGNSYLKRNSLHSDFSSFQPGPVHPDVTPEMIRTASDMMTKMSEEERQKIHQMASSLKGKDSVSTAAASHSNGLRSDSVSTSAEALENFSVGGNHVDETTSNSRTTSQSRFSNPTADLQEQMTTQMNDPAMRQMFTSMIKNISPDMMANMGEQFGLELSREDAEKAQQTMSSLSPDDLDRMIAVDLERHK
ncbi:hypothetical protein U1Q18_025293 [Sarracenia purpurea var. burkii]